MSENDPRFGYPIEFVKQHVLGCFESSKDCAILPGKPHLYHVEFLKREGIAKIEDGSAMPLDFYLQAHISPCEEVTWYLHTRKDFTTYEGSEQPDEQYVKDNEQGVIAADSVPTTPENYVDTMTDTFGCYSCANPSKKVSHSHACKATMTRTFGCNACAVVNSELPHSHVCNKRRSRFDKLNKELGMELWTIIVCSPWETKKELEWPPLEWPPNKQKAQGVPKLETKRRIKE